jgi:Protein N-terminal asparagine amidohydrolase
MTWDHPDSNMIATFCFFWGVSAIVPFDVCVGSGTACIAHLDGSKTAKSIQQMFTKLKQLSRGSPEGRFVVMRDAITSCLFTVIPIGVNLKRKVGLNLLSLTTVVYIHSKRGIQACGPCRSLHCGITPFWPLELFCFFLHRNIVKLACVAVGSLVYLYFSMLSMNIFTCSTEC